MIGLERALSRWQAAGLIDARQAGEIRRFEQAERRPLGMMVVAALALLALGLGILLVVAANWDLIPGWVKLSGHFLAMIAAAGVVLLGERRQRQWLREGGAIVLVVLVIAGIALQGQHYQLTSDLWQPFVLWAVLSAPLLLVAGSTWLTGGALTLVAGATGLVLGFEGMERETDTLFLGLAAGMPYLVLLVTMLAQKRGSFLQAVRAVTLGSVLLLASLVHLLWAFRFSADDAAEGLRILVLPFVLLIACLALIRNEPDRRLTVTILVASFAAAALAMTIPHGDGWHWQLFGALSFIAMWGVVAGTSLSTGARTVFGIASFMIGLRIFVIYFEVFGTLAATGTGLIVAGLLLLALLAGGRRIVRRFGGRR